MIIYIYVSAMILIKKWLSYSKIIFKEPFFNVVYFHMYL